MTLSNQQVDGTYIDWRHRMIMDTAGQMADELAEGLTDCALASHFTCGEAVIIFEFLIYWARDKKVAKAFMQAHAHSDEHGDDHHHSFDSECNYCHADYFFETKQEEGK